MTTSVLDGLDPTNSKAASRAIVVHGAWYVSRQMIVDCGMLGRSEGCFAVANSSLNEILTRLGPGRLIYADKAWAMHPASIDHEIIRSASQERHRPSAV
jgi:L,D-transpeptidase-like protein